MAEPGGGNNSEARASLSPMGEAPIRVLVVDDESAVRNAIARVLRNAAMIVATAESGSGALELLDREAFDVLLLDVRMPFMTGPQLLSRMKEMGAPAQVIMMTAFADIATTAKAVRDGAYGFLTKPFVANEAIIIEVGNAARHKRLRERIECLLHELMELRRRGAAVLTSAGTIEGISCPAAMASPRPIEAAITALSLHELSYEDAEKRVLSEFTEAYIVALLRSTDGDMSEAARRSGLERATLLRLVRIFRGGAHVTHRPVQVQDWTALESGSSEDE